MRKTARGMLGKMGTKVLFCLWVGAQSAQASSLDATVLKVVQWFKKEYPSILVHTEEKKSVGFQMHIQGSAQRVECTLIIGALHERLSSSSSYEGQRTYYMGSPEHSLAAGLLHELGHCAFGVQVLRDGELAELFNNRRFHEAYADVFSVYALKKLYGDEVAKKTLAFSVQQRRLASLPEYQIAPVLESLQQKGLASGSVCAATWSALQPFTNKQVTKLCQP